MNRNYEAFRLWESGETNAAVALLFKEIEEHPESSDSYCNLASMLISAEHYGEAGAVLHTAMEKHPNHPSVLYAFGNFYYQQQKYPEALENFSHVFESAETDLKNDAAIMIGQSYAALQQPQRALAFLLTAYTKDSDDLTVILLIGNCFIQTGAFEDAQPFFEKAVQLSPENDEAWFKRGLASMALEEEPSSYQLFFQKAAELNPADQQIRMEQMEEIKKMIKNQKP